MGNSAFDVPALLLAIAVSLAIVGALVLAHRGENTRRTWIVAAALALLFGGLAMHEVSRESPRETHIATIILGATLPVLGAIGAIRGTGRVRRVWIRWPLVFLATFVSLFAGLLVGATVVPRYL